MKKGVDASSRFGPGVVYGLGLIGTPLSCGGTSWGHGGTIHGYQTDNAVGPDGTAAIFAVTALPTAIADQNNPESSAKEKHQRIKDAVDATLCHK